MPKKIFFLANENVRERAIEFVAHAPIGKIVEIKDKSRSLDQNAAQWPILDAFAEQLEWPVNGSMSKLSAEEWKDILTAAFHNETARLAMGLNGGVVMLGLRTSKMNKKRFSEWLDFLHFVASERGIDIQGGKNE